jgi:hypothetical protein
MNLFDVKGFANDQNRVGINALDMELEKLKKL